MAAIPIDVAQAFMSGEPARRGEFKSTGDALYSYDLRLAYRLHGRVFICEDLRNRRGVTPTTGRHMIALLGVLDDDTPTPSFYTIDDIKSASASAGQHWFEPGTMRFFNSRVLDGVYGLGYFVSSERYKDEPRRYTVRRACADGSIDTVGEFQAYATAAQAKRAARDAA